MLQTENKTMQEHLDYLEKEIELCREDIRYKESTINDNQSHWLTILSIVIGAIVTVLGIGLGVIAPIVLNYRNDRKQKKIIEKVRSELKNKIDAVQQDAKSAKDSLSEVTELKANIEAIRKEIDKSKKAAERSAKKSLAIQYYAQALIEKNKSKAIELYTKTIELYPNIPDPYNKRGALKEET